MEGSERESKEMFLIETSILYHMVEENKVRFIHGDLLRFSAALDVTLCSGSRSTIVIDRSVSQSFFDNHIEFRNSNQHVSFDWPVPDYFAAPSSKNDVLVFVKSDENVILENNNQYFRLFFAFYLAAIEYKKIEDFLLFHLKETFFGNFKEFTQFLDFIFSDFTTIVGTREQAIRTIIQGLPYNQVSLYNGAAQALSSDALPQNDVESNREEYLNEKDLAGVEKAPNRSQNALIDRRITELSVILEDTRRDFLMIEERLIERGFLGIDYKWKRKKIELVAFIHLLREHEFVRPVKREDGNYSLRRLTDFFGKRYKCEIRDAAKPSNFPEDKLPKMVPVFKFIFSDL